MPVFPIFIIAFHIRLPSLSLSNLSTGKAERLLNNGQDKQKFSSQFGDKGNEFFLLAAGEVDGLCACPQSG